LQCDVTLTYALRNCNSVRASICEFTTLPASFGEDLAAYAAAGAGGIGVCESKLGGGARAGLRESGLAATHCVPAVPSILPLPSIPGPADPAARVEALCAGVRRLAELEPVCVLFLTGPGGEEERRLVLEALPVVAAAAREAGVRLALEPVHESQAGEFSFVHSLDEAAALLDEAGAESVELLFDTFHLWDTPDLGAQIARHAGRIAGVHVADRREPTRGAFDRVLPGDGAIDLAPILRALADAGYRGWWDVEIFSDDGSFGQRLPDSLWEAPARELARRAVAALGRVAP
jgi:sugar phosphate isomerase/epimerase